MRIGVIGSGIAGLVSARKLCDAGHQVTLFERQSSVGMDAHSLDISTADEGRTVRADVPSRMFNEAQWPSLWNLYNDLGIESTGVCSSQTFSHFPGNVFLTLEQAIKPTALIGKLLDRKSQRILTAAAKLQKTGAQDLQQDDQLASLTLGEYLKQRAYSDEFVREFLYPTLSSTVFTCSFSAVANYPAKTALQILQNLTRETTLLKTRFGTQDATTRMLQADIELRLSCGVKEVECLDDQVRVRLPDGTTEFFDHVIVATQANTALKLVKDLSNNEQEILGSFQYESLSVYVHTDTDWMPNQRSQWGTFNMLVSEDRNAAMCSVWLNRFHTDWQIDQPVFQTINAFAQPDPEKILAECVMQRPIITPHSNQGWDAIDTLHQQPNRRIWFCGSYAGRGTPLLESGVMSALSVVEAVDTARVGSVS
ncbi:MAG: FAD-dependent oxidoreductase [Pirellulaceae bacterium]|nr:FAD-dependent oxidoreductase [Pirellulaceae bacterium]